MYDNPFSAEGVVFTGLVVFGVFFLLMGFWQARREADQQLMKDQADYEAALQYLDDRDASLPQMTPRSYSGAETGRSVTVVPNPSNFPRTVGGMTPGLGAPYIDSLTASGPTPDYFNGATA